MLSQNIVYVPGTKETGSPLRGHRIWLRYVEFTKRRLFTGKRMFSKVKKGQNSIFHYTYNKQEASLK